MEDHGINIQKFEVATTPDEAEQISKTFSKCDHCANWCYDIIVCLLYPLDLLSQVHYHTSV